MSEEAFICSNIGGVVDLARDVALVCAGNALTSPIPFQVSQTADPVTAIGTLCGYDGTGTCA